MVITIDGPAGAGKSTISKRFASDIDFEVLDTGAMYRCAALILKNKNCSVDDTAFKDDILNMDISFDNGEVYLNGRNVSLEIRTPEIDVLASSVVSVDPFIRQEMGRLQRRIAENRNFVAEGRDMGTNVFKDSPLKFYITATPETRALRRHKELQQKNIEKNLDELKIEIINRDKNDSSRKYNPLSVPENAVIIDTDELTVEQVLQKMKDAYQNIDAS